MTLEAAVVPCGGRGTRRHPVLRRRARWSARAGIIGRDSFNVGVPEARRHAVAARPPRA